MKILGLIPARGGSKGVPNKNIKLLAGKPLIAYTITEARRSKSIADIVVSTDSGEIQSIAIQYNAEVPFLRPAKLATDTAKSIDVVTHALHTLKEHDRHYDAVILLQPTNPFRTAAFIDLAIGTYVENNYDSLISVLPVPHEYNPHWVFEPTPSGTLRIATGEQEIISRRQELPPAFFRDGSIYITSVEVLLSKHSFYGDKLGYVVADPTRHVNIDTMADWELAEIKYKELF
jgi:N-acylneuraminate cytidylyltransferase